MKFMSSLVFLLVFIIILPSCLNSRMKDPELVDLIYLDMLNDIDRATKTIIIRKDEITKVAAELEGLPARSPETPVKTERIRVLSEDVKRLEQLKKYFEIKKEKRKVLARIKYELSYNEKKEWPNQKEFKKYLIAKEFANSPIYTINKSDNSRSSTHKKDVQEILDADKEAQKKKK